MFVEVWKWHKHRWEEEKEYRFISMGLVNIDMVWHINNYPSQFYKGIEKLKENYYCIRLKKEFIGFDTYNLSSETYYINEIDYKKILGSR